MSTTYNIVCDKCRKSAWVGQHGAGSPAGWLYPVKKLLEGFLYAHVGHPLRFLSCHYWDGDSEDCLALLQYEEQEADDER